MSETAKHSPQTKPLDRLLTITVFKDEYAKTKKEFSRSLRQIIPTLQKRSASRKEQLPWLKLARFGLIPTGAGCLRHDANVQTVEGVEIDYDGEKMPILAAAQRFQKLGVGCLLYTSPSHKPAKPRWRGLFALSGPTAPGERRHLVACLNGVLDGVLKGDSFGLSQSYYYGKVGDNPHHEIIPVDEPRFLDKVAAELDAGAIYNDAEADELKPHESDRTNSGRGLALAGRTARNGGSLEDFEEAIPDNAAAAAWVDKAGRSGQRQINRAWAIATRDIPEELKQLGLNEDALADAFAARFSDNLRWCNSIRRWYEWTGTHWRHEETKLALEWARQLCRALRRKNPAEAGAAALAKVRTAEGVEKFAQADRRIAILREAFDRDPWLLATPSGTIDLRTGEVRPARQEDLISKITAVGPCAPELDIGCPKWLKFLIEVTGNDKDVIRFLQQWFGYCLTGIIREQCFLFIFGFGGNGKGVLLNIIIWILGDYAKVAPMEVFAMSRYDRHPTELARLWNARFVAASETEEGRAWAETRLKQMTGGDPITSHFMRQDDFTYNPQFKLTFIGNSQPGLKNVEAAERRRINMLPFDFEPKVINKNLEMELREEGSEILSWMIAGCLDWQKNGLIRPEKLLRATEEYFNEQDTFGQWLDTQCRLGKSFTATRAELYVNYSAYAIARGDTARSATWFSKKLQRCKFTKGKDNLDNRIFYGLKLLSDFDEL